MFGPKTILSIGRQVPASADGAPEYKPGGVTIDWATVPANAADTTLADGSVIAAGTKYLPFGTILAQIGVAATDVVTLNNTPTGGTFTVSVTAGGSTQTTAGLAYNASAATVQTAVRSLSNVGGTLATVTGSAGGPYTIAFDNSLGAVTVAASGASLTGSGAQPTATVGVTAPGGDVGLFGPYDAGATDGRQTLARGACYILNYTYAQTDPHADTVPGVFEGGLVFIARVKAVSGGAFVAGWNNTVAAAFPRVRLCQ